MISYTYDELGRRLTRELDGTSTWHYDALGRVAENLGLTNPLGSFFPKYVIGNGAPTGRLDWVEYPNGMKVDLDWDNVGDRRLKQIKNLASATTELSKFDYSYDTAGQITQWTQWHSGLGTGTPARRWVLGSDAADQLKTAEVRDDSNGALLKLFGYGYDAAGNRTTEQTDSSVASWTTNPSNQLLSRNAGGGKAQVIGAVSEPSIVKVNNQAVPVDSNHVWRTELEVVAGVNSFPVEATEINYTAGTNAQTTHRTLNLTVAASTPRTLSYDANGCLIDDGTRAFKWDAAQRLVAIDYTNTTRHTEFSYDGFSRRIKIVEKDGDSVMSDKRFVWEGMEIVEERDANNAVVKQFFPEGERRGTSNYFYFRDHLGSVREITDSAGVVQSRYDYDPYGQRTKLSGAPEPISGTLLHESENVDAVHQHLFTGASETLAIATGDSLTAWVWIDPQNPPRELALQWNSTSEGWHHRAFWGTDELWDNSGNYPRHNMGALPAAGGWVKLVVPANLVGVDLVGKTVSGMAFTLSNGHAWWDRVGKTNQTGGTVVDTVWFDDAAPAGATAPEGWNWSSGGIDASFGFTEHYYHTASALHLAPFRAYDAGVARWLSRDPSGEDGGLNLYGYVSNSPANRIDPLGLADVPRLIPMTSSQAELARSAFGPGGAPGTLNINMSLLRNTNTTTLEVFGNNAQRGIMMAKSPNTFGNQFARYSAVREALANQAESARRWGPLAPLLTGVGYYSAVAGLPAAKAFAIAPVASSAGVCAAGAVGYSAGRLYMQLPFGGDGRSLDSAWEQIWQEAVWDRWYSGR